MEMSWEEFSNRYPSNFNFKRERFVETDIHCPMCDKFIRFDTMEVCTSLPPTYKYVCKCGWHGYSTKKWSNF